MGSRAAAETYLSLLVHGEGTFAALVGDGPRLAAVEEEARLDGVPLERIEGDGRTVLRLRRPDGSPYRARLRGWWWALLHGPCGLLTLEGLERDFRERVERDWGARRDGIIERVVEARPALGGR